MELAWSWKRDVTSFWPTWLGDNDDLSSFRIFSFGYNANIKGAATNLNTIDFAKDLLFSMLSFSGRSQDGTEGSFSIESRPIIFVAHSMGGLVVKKAYILGKHDRQYSDVIAQVHGILFLATPHRGSGKWAVFPGLDLRIRDAVQQFVFSNDEKLLLISTSLQDLV